MRDHKGEKQRTNQESYDHQNCSSSSTPPSSNSSSPSHEFSFTISFQQTKQIPLPSSSSSSTTTTSSSFAIDLSPADDIFFHGHLLPLHLLSHLPISSPRSSTNSLDSYTLPKKDHFFHQDQNFQDFKNQRVLLDDHDTCCDPILHQTPHIARTLMHPTAHDTCCDVKGKPKAKSFSLFGIPKWRKGYEVNDQKDSNKERSHSQQYSNKMTQLVKRYIRMVRPFLSFRNKKNMQFHRESYSFSGNLLSSRGIKGQYSSAPASMRTSPTNSGLLVATPTRGGAKGQPAALKLPLYTGSREGSNHKDLLYATEGGANYNNCTNSSSYSSSDSTMEELQAAIQAAIAHCKKSISMEDKINSAKFSLQSPTTLISGVPFRLSTVNRREDFYGDNNFEFFVVPFPFSQAWAFEAIPYLRQQVNYQEDVFRPRILRWLSAKTDKNAKFLDLFNPSKEAVDVTVEATAEEHNITVDNPSTASKEEEKGKPFGSGEW
ncbi:hypothetical protein BC332_07107 [Capsicum chinense]|nr:hypothetical protein BC332_07107 [Capsicum chinense]